MRACGDVEWQKAVVPGSVLTDLIRNGILKDAYKDFGMLDAQKFTEKDYEYVRTFKLPDEVLLEDRLELICFGIDTIAEITVNGVLIAETDDMHRTYRFDVKNVCTAGENSIRILLKSPMIYAREKAKTMPTIGGKGLNAEAGFESIRKGHSMYGWDSEPDIPDSGIWRDIEINAYSDGRIEDVYVAQRHQDGKVEVTAELNADLWSDADVRVRFELTAPNGYVYQDCAIIRCGKNLLRVTVNDPELWWPNGYGDQPLYRAAFTMEKEGRILDTKEFRIGLREFHVRREADQWGESFEFVCNGKAVFAKGADLIPPEKFLPMSRGERNRTLIDDCVKAHMNCIRVWGGGVFPDDEFFDLCDENGILIWEDLMLACSPCYVFDEHFLENLRLETRDNVIRLRNHPSLAIWNGDNELEWLIGGDPLLLPLALPDEVMNGYLNVIDNVFGPVIKKYDPERLFWPSSPSSGGHFFKTNDESRGDVHYWYVWHGAHNPYTDYSNHYFRFVSEFGLQSFPTYKTMKEFISPEGLSPTSEIMDFHQRNNGGYGTPVILFYLAQDLPIPAKFEDFVRATQIVQGEAMVYCLEHLRRNMERCYGALYWQIDDCWPAPSWSSTDYCGRWKASHYMMKRVYAPVLVSALPKDGKVELHVSNDPHEMFCGVVKWAIRGRAGECVASGEKTCEIGPHSSALAAEIALPEGFCPNTQYIDYCVVGNGTENRGTLLLVKPKHFRFLDPELSAEVTEKDGIISVAVTASSYARRVSVDFENDDIVFDDNFFDLNAGETKVITAQRVKKDVSDLDTLRKEIVVKSIYDLF